MQTEGDEDMKEWKLIKTIHLIEDAEGISFNIGDGGSTFSLDELYIVGIPISDGTKKDITFFKSENYSYGQDIFTLSDILSNNADGSSYFSLLLKKVPDNVIALCLYNKYNSDVGRNSKITGGNMGSYPANKFTRLDLAVWSAGTLGMFKSGSSFEVYGR